MVVKGKIHPAAYVGLLKDISFRYSLLHNSDVGTNGGLSALWLFKDGRVSNVLIRLLFRILINFFL